MLITAEIAKIFRFEAAHFLPNTPKGHQCENIHGHSYKVVVRARGPIDEKTGWVMDLAHISERFEPLKKILDHSLLNNIKGLENPTTENLAVWLIRELLKTLPEVSSVSVGSTERISVTISKEDVLAVDVID